MQSRAVARGKTVFYMGEPFKECETEQQAADLAEKLNDVTIY